MAMHLESEKPAQNHLRPTRQQITFELTPQGQTRQADASQAVDLRIPATYIWVLVPDQPDSARPAS
jgi:hypothetical protein